mmetsp:Transcript_8142/g.17638  ORF Transcript_8142/g.17638 Transcript_8142/m.17638 type:complete len:119 (-) Transcript_8142:73-429(-)
MTIIYNNKSHLSVIFKLQGSIWPEVLPFCIFNVAVTLAIWIMRERDVVDLHFDGGIGYQFISVLVSFFVVTNINTTYNRFWDDIEDILGKNGHSTEAFFASAFDCTPSKGDDGYDSLV